MRRRMDDKTPGDLVLESLRGVIDPELGINVVDLGLVYNVDVAADGVHVTMGVTTSTCPLGSYLIEAAESAIRAALPTVRKIEVVLARNPPWSPDRMSSEAKEQLGWKR